MLVPPPTSGTRDAWNSLVMKKGCPDEVREKDKKACKVLREDGAAVETDEDVDVKAEIEIEAEVDEDEVRALVDEAIASTGSLDLTLWIEAYIALVEGGLGIGANNPQNALTRTITNSAPLLLAGLSVALGFKAGLFNIGANGQVIIGGLTAAIVGAMVATWSPFLAIPTAVLAGAAASFFLRSAASAPAVEPVRPAPASLRAPLAC